MINSNVFVTKEDILNKIPQEEIFHKYMGIYPDCKLNYRNPLRDINNIDNRATCRFYYDNRGILKFNDFAKKFNIDCFNLVQYKFKVNFNDAINLIAEDFNLKEKTIDRELLEKRSLIQLDLFKKTKILVKIREFTQYDLDYWGKYLIEKQDLQFYNVYPVSHAWIDDSLIYKERGLDVCYCYYFWGDNYKLYFPNRKENRFIHNNSKIVQGFKQLPLEAEHLVVTKSLKDVICMRKFDIYAVAPQAETILIHKEAMNNLKQRFTNIYTLFDRDYAGITLTNTYKKTYNTTKLIFDKNDEKDFTDNLLINGINFMLDYIQETKDKLNIY